MKNLNMLLVRELERTSKEVESDGRLDVYLN